MSAKRSIAERAVSDGDTRVGIPATGQQVRKKDHDK
jgi:hypothetical protein